MKKLALCTFVVLLLLSVFAGCGNHTEANTTIIATISGQPTGTVSYQTADFTVTGTDIVSYKYKLDSDTWSTETSVSMHIILSNLADGLHIISVVGKDAAGKWQTEASSTTASWTVNQTINQESKELSGSQTVDLEINVDYNKLWETWKLTPEVNLLTSDGLKQVIDPSNCNWSSSNNNVATVDNLGLITAVSGGTVDITGTYNGISKSITLTVAHPVLNPVEENIDPYLSTPAPDYVYEMPVVIIRYLPSSDGTNLDVAYAPGYWSLDPVSLSSMKSNLDLFDKRTKFILEEGSKFHGYKDSNARPSLGYRIVKILTVYEPPPPGKFWYMNGDRKVFYVDNNAIFERFGLSSFIETNNVKEVWLNFGGVSPGEPSYNPTIHGPEAMINMVESNMSSPTTGDISNSDRRNDDLPILNHTYTVYDYNIRRSHAENVENHMHQLESLYGYIDGELFWNKFAGFVNGKITTPARCGWTHFPPNGTSDYDWNNKTFVSSDIEDWTPDNTGTRKLVNSDTWCSIPRNWPDNVNISWSTEYASNWFLYLMQNWPGYGNQIRYGSNWMTNWWEFTADWDKAITINLGLYASSAPPALPMEGDVNLDGHVTITDAMLIARYKAGLLILTDEQLQCADTTDDGIVSMADAMHISQWLVDPDGSLGVLFMPLWESPADDNMLQPVPK